MNDLTLSKRLLVAFAAVRDGSICADVGCDHGKLAAKLVMSKKSPFVYAVDINQKPLDVATRLFEKLNITDKTKTVLSNGLEKISKNDVDDVIIAGIGADISIDIISSAKWLKDNNKQLVLVPSSRHHVLRGFLFENGFEIVNETPVFEQHHNYTVITANFCNNSIKPTVIQRYLGLIANDSSNDGILYKKEVLRRANKIATSVQKAKTVVSSERLDEAKILTAYLEPTLKGDIRCL